MAPLLNCTCVKTWRGVAHSVNSREYCGYFIGKCHFSKANRMPVSTNLFQVNNYYFFVSKLQMLWIVTYNYTFFCPSFVSRNITRQCMRVHKLGKLDSFNTLFSIQCSRYMPSLMEICEQWLILWTRSRLFKLIMFIYFIFCTLLPLLW